MSDMVPETGQGTSGDSGASESNSAGGQFEQPGASVGGTTGQESAPTGYNPVWDEAFNAIPDVPEFKDKLRPVFEKWDSNNNSRYEKVQQEFAPYKPLLENNVPFEDIQAAFELRNRLATDPKEIFEKLANHLGYDLSKFEADGDEESQGQEYSDEDDDPRFTALQQENAQIKAMLQQQAQERIAQEQAVKQEQQEKAYYEQTVSELDKLESTYGKFDRNKAVQFAIWEAETNGTDVSLEAGLKAMKAFQGEVLQQSANRQAPDVFSGNGSLASGRVDTSKMSEDEFQAYAVARMKAKLG